MANNKYGVLNQSDFNLIFEKLDTVKLNSSYFLFSLMNSIATFMVFMVAPDKFLPST